MESGREKTKVEMMKIRLGGIYIEVLGGGSNWKDLRADVWRISCETANGPSVVK